MMPPVSLPLNGGTHWACAGMDASIPQIATRLAATIFRITDSISASAPSSALQALKRTARPDDAELWQGVAVLHLTSSGLRGTVRPIGIKRIPMRDLLKSPMKSGLAAVLGALLGFLAFGEAQAASPMELNFWL